MKEKTRLFILKLLTACAVFSAAYSSVLVLRVCLFGKSGGIWAFIFALLLSGAGITEGCVFRSRGRFIDKLSVSKAANILMTYKNYEARRRAVASILLYCSGIVPVFAMLILFSRQGILRAAFEAASILAVYYPAIKCGLNEAYDNMTKRAEMTAFVVFLASLCICYYYPPLMPFKQYVSIFAYIFLLAYLIVKNQEDIDSNIFAGRFVEKSVLPKEIRIFNLKVIIIMFTVILLLLNLKVIVMLLTQIGDWLLAGLRALLSLLNTNEPVKLTKNPLPQQSSQNYPFFGGSSQAPENPLRAYIRGVLITTVILYIAVKLAVGLWQYVIKKLLPFLFGKIKGFFRLRVREKLETGGDYDDEIEIEKPVSERVSRREARARVKKACRDLKNITDPVERVRCMYASILGLLQVKGIKITASDTVWDVYGKTSELQDIGTPFGVLSEKYERVRYGNIIPKNAELSDTERSYSEITAILGR